MNARTAEPVYDDWLINVQAVAAWVAVSVPTINRWVAKDSTSDFPRPIRIGTCVRWSHNEVKQYQASRFAARAVTAG